MFYFLSNSICLCQPVSLKFSIFVTNMPIVKSHSLDMLLPQPRYPSRNGRTHDFPLKNNHRSIFHSRYVTEWHACRTGPQVEILGARDAVRALILDTAGVKSEELGLDVRV